jgi:hypothetical protein
MEHNHSLETAEAIYYTRPSRAVRQQFDEYFMGGMNVLEATRAHGYTCTSGLFGAI